MTTSTFKAYLRRWAVKIASLLVTGLVLGLAYDWAAPRLYRTDSTAGFWLGAAHGALMPAALPSLLMGRDVPIFTERNTGRPYKLGYIAGINLCGFIFFGMAFWQPSARRRPPEPSSPSQ
ncbi:MAG: hypothetical protein HZA90_01485 [Verrucomicrobia bacterium]|nr:hypothetical protein [Verrucomicrobiota bacterium]